MEEVKKSNKKFRIGLVRALRITGRTAEDVVSALADDGTINPMEGASIGLRLVARLWRRHLDEDEAAWIRFGKAIAERDRTDAIAALDEIMGWA